MSLEQIIKNYNRCVEKTGNSSNSENLRVCESTKNLKKLCQCSLCKISHTTQSESSRIASYVCRDRYREQLTDYSMKRGLPTIKGQSYSTFPYGVGTDGSNVNGWNFPFQNYPRYIPKHTNTKFITVNDMERLNLPEVSMDARIPFRNNSIKSPFTNSEILSVSGDRGEFNRTKPYQYLYNFLHRQNDCDCTGSYGEILKSTKPQQKDVN
jgi:hypothetical protein